MLQPSLSEPVRLRASLFSHMLCNTQCQFSTEVYHATTLLFCAQHVCQSLIVYVLAPVQRRCMRATSNQAGSRVLRCSLLLASLRWSIHELTKTTKRKYAAGSFVRMPPSLPQLKSSKDMETARSWIEEFKRVVIPRDAVELSFSRSSGPGGQVRCTRGTIITE